MSTTTDVSLPSLSIDLDTATLIGKGGEASVYAVSESQVLRVLHAGGNRDTLQQRVHLQQRIQRSGGQWPFRTPHVIKMMEVAGRAATLEERFPGVPLDTALASSEPADHRRIIHAWLDAAAQLGEVDLGADRYGDALPPDAERHTSFHDYWTSRLAHSLRSRGDLYRSVDAAAIACAMPEPNAPALVHLDLFAGNLLWDGNAISAVLDFGSATIQGDARLNVLFASVFASTGFDATTSVMEWLHAHELDRHLDAATRMVAAYWSFVEDDGPLDSWCRQVLLSR